MKYKVIALCSDYLGCYDQPTFSNLSEEDVMEQYRRSVLADPDGAYKARASEKSLFVLGEFDDVSGVILPFKQPKKLVSLASYFPAGYLAKKETTNA